MLLIKTRKKIVLASIGLNSNKNKSRKSIMRRRTAIGFRRWSLVGLVFALCFSLGPMPVYAASTGDEHHDDTRDYCMFAHDVTVGLQELE